MSIENIKSNIVNVAVSGVMRTLNLEQVLFATVGSTTSAVYVNEGSTPVTFTIEGDFRNLVAGAGGSGMNAGPLFGAFTDVSSKVPVVLNFDKINRFISGSSITFNRYGTVSAFTYNLLEPIMDVLGGTGHSIQDVGIFSVTAYSTLAAPVQSASTKADTGGTIAAATYFSKVTAVNALGETTESNEVSVTATTSASTLTFNWATVTGATGYWVYIGTGAGSENVKLFVSGGGSTTVTITSLPTTAGTVPSANTALTSTREYINIKNVTHQIPSGTNWTTLFTDAASVVYVENLQDLVGGP